ncbi:hypothetical protein WMF30_49635 [Sorangium sp. So ce134]
MEPIRLPGIDLGLVAQRTSGMVGADLANAVNEATLAAALRGSALASSATSRRRSTGSGSA